MSVQVPDLAELRRQRPSSTTLAHLAAGPWAWPVDDSRGAALARSLSAGSVALVATTPTGVELWRFDADGPTPSTAAARFLATADAAFDNAAAALESSLPFSFRPVQRLRHRERRAANIAVVDQVVARPSSTLDGPSFGLGFALALASAALGTAVAADVISSAAVLPDGRLQPVRDIEKKLLGVRSLAPTLRRFLVAAGQFTADELLSAQARLAPLQIVVVAHVLDAVEVAIGAFESLVAGVEDGFVDGVTRDFFTLALRHRQPVVSWRSVWQTSQRIQRRPHLSFESEQRLRFVDMIAGRHDHHCEPLARPSWAFVDAQRRSLRMQLVAQLVQQLHDLGWPAEDELRPRVSALLPADLRDADSSQLMLAGSWGRLIALWGEADSALSMQRAAAEGFLDAGDDVEVSHPLCEALRLSALLGDRSSFGSMVAIRDELVRRRPQDESSGFLQLALGRGRVLLSDDAGRSDLASLMTRRDVPLYLRASAARWLVATGDTSAVALLQEPASRMWRLLAEIDRSTTTDATLLVDALERDGLAGAAVRHLRRGFSNPKQLAHWFPY